MALRSVNYILKPRFTLTRVSLQQQCIRNVATASPLYNKVKTGIIMVNIKLNIKYVYKVLYFTIYNNTKFSSIWVDQLHFLMWNFSSIISLVIEI